MLPRTFRSWALVGCDLDTTPLGFLRIPAAIELTRLRSYGDAAVSLGPEEVARYGALEAAISVNEHRQRLLPSLAKPSGAGLDLSPPATEIDRQAWQNEFFQLQRRQAEQANQTHSIGLDINTRLKSGGLVAWCWRHDNGDISEVLPEIFWHSDAATAAFRGERWFVPLVPNGTILGHQATAILRRSDVEACYAGGSAEVSSGLRKDGELKKTFLLRRIGNTQETPTAGEFRELARDWLEVGATAVKIKEEGKKLQSSWRRTRTPRAHTKQTRTK